MMQNLDPQQLDEQLSAYLDGELEAAETVIVEGLLQSDASVQRRLEQLRVTAGLVASLPRHPAPETIADSVRAHIERTELIGDVEDSPIQPGRKRFPLQGLVSMAAMFTVVATGVWYMTHEAGLSQPVAPADQRLALKEEASPSTSAAKSIVSKLDNSAVDWKSRSMETDSLPTKAMQPPIRPDYFRAANMDQKLAHAKLPDVLTSHEFANEPIRLQVRVGSAIERDRVADRVQSFLAARHANVSFKGTGGKDVVASSGGAFVFEGKPPVNFTELGQRQFLVRANRRDLGDLFNILERDKSIMTPVALQSGPVVLQSAVEVQTALLGEPPPAPQGSLDSTEQQGQSTVTASDPLLPLDAETVFADIFDALGLDIGLFGNAAFHQEDEDAVELFIPVDPSGQQPLLERGDTVARTGRGDRARALSDRRAKGKRNGGVSGLRARAMGEMELEPLEDALAKSNATAHGADTPGSSKPMRRRGAKRKGPMDRPDLDTQSGLVERRIGALEKSRRVKDASAELPIAEKRQPTGRLEGPILPSKPKLEREAVPEQLSDPITFVVQLIPSTGSGKPIASPDSSKQPIRKARRGPRQQKRDRGG